jgi:hypothetical protein
MSPRDPIERKIAELQAQMDKQARLNAITAAQSAMLQLQLLSQQLAIRLETERTQALTFLFNQQTQRIIRYEFIQRAITTASNDYLGIMLSEGRKPLNLGLLVTFITFAVVPEYAALSEACKILSDKWKPAIQLAKSIGKTVDIAKYAGSGGQDRRGTFGVINQVVKEVYDRILEDEADMGSVVQAFTEAILNGAPQPLQLVQNYWRQANLQTLQPSGFVAAKKQSDLLSDIILYDMLREYTRSYVVISFDKMPGPVGPAFATQLLMESRMLDSKRLKDIPNGIVSVKGLNDDQREMIYGRFSNVAWTDASRPPVNSWRDLVSVWGARVPGFDTERRVDARFIGKKGPF